MIKSIKNIKQVHDLLGLDEPVHPYISVLRENKFKTEIPRIEKPIPTEIYSVSLKTGSECSISYGRRVYDYKDGALLFLAPGQSFYTGKKQTKNKTSEIEGWTLLVHPDFLHIDNYSYFSYESTDALHLSKVELEELNGIINNIEEELFIFDIHSKKVISSYLELFFSLCFRYYNRQFETRRSESSDLLIRFESYMNRLFNLPEIDKELLSVKRVAKELGYSSNYFCDLLKRDTGKTPQEQLYFFLFKRAKYLLKCTDRSINSIAYSLGFEYPQHFSKLFKAKVGQSPSNYRKMNIKTFL